MNKKAKKYLSEKGYGTGSNFTVNTVANLMSEYATKEEDKIVAIYKKLQGIHPTDEDIAQSVQIFLSETHTAYNNKTPMVNWMAGATYMREYYIKVLGKLDDKTPVNPLLEDVLSREEILEGNKLMLDFMGFESNKSDKWIIECSLYDRTWDELMKVVEKISVTYGEYADGINSATFNFKHMMFHEIIGKQSFLYRKCVRWIKIYKEATSKNIS